MMALTRVLAGVKMDSRNMGERQDLVADKKEQGVDKYEHILAKRLTR